MASPANGHARAAAPTTVLPLPALTPGVDHGEVRELHDKVAAVLSDDRDYRALTDPEDRRHYGRNVVQRTVAAWTPGFASARGYPVPEAEEDAYVQAVFDLQYGAGRLEPLLNLPDVENIFYQNGLVYIDRGRGEYEPAARIADNEEGIEELVRDLARRSGFGERQYSAAHPLLSLRLDDGSRLQAIRTALGSYLAIRRHRTLKVTLDDLCTGQITQDSSPHPPMIDSTIMAFLKAAVRARLNIMVVGAQAVGKTSLLRALIAEIPAHERICTLESEYELFTHTDGVHTQVLPLEMRAGNGEMREGHAVGEISLATLIPPALRMSLSRLIVGEVRSDEVLPMLDVMQTSEGGSMCTLHVRRPGQVFRRLAGLVRRYSALDGELAMELAADALDLVVHVRMVDLPDPSGSGSIRYRYVAEILEVTGMGDHGRPAVNRVFAPRPEIGEFRAVPATTPSQELLRELGRHGFNDAWLGNQGGTWGQLVPALGVS